MALLAEHQRDAVERLLVLLDRRGGAILADDVGLGKSHVAAALARTMIGRGVAIELIVPAALVDQWRETLRLFGVNATILTHDGIVSRPFVADPTRNRLVIVDEAHAFRNPRTQRFAALGRRSLAAALLLVTATPFCNSLRDVETLVSLIAADDLLGDRGVPSIDLAFARRDREAIEIVLGELLIRRDRDVLPAQLRFGTLQRSVIRHSVYGAADSIEALQFPLIGHAHLLRRFLHRRLESSEAALRESLRRQMRFYDRALDSLAAGRALSKRDYRRIFGREEDAEALQQVLFWDLFVGAGVKVDADLIREEQGRIERLARDLDESPCQKRRQFVTLAGQMDEPMLVFTTAAATAADLLSALAPIRRCAIATARQRRDAIAAVEAFRRGEIDVLIATDLASEGLNLQRAGVVVHYDIPWNPVKLDQRNGRALRIGQKRSSVRAIYFLPERDATGVVATVAAKNRARRTTIHTREIDEAACHPSTLRPRVTRDSAALRFIRTARRYGLEVPECVAKRHRAGVERLLDEMSREYLDEKRVGDLLALIK